MAYIDNPVDSNNCWDDSDFVSYWNEIEHFNENQGWDHGEMLEMIIDKYNDGWSTDEAMNQIEAYLKDND